MRLKNYPTMRISRSETVTIPKVHHVEEKL